MERVCVVSLSLVVVLGGLTGCGRPTPTPAPAPAARTVTTLPCVAGTPALDDFDGDGSADLVIGATGWDGTQVVRHHYLQPGDGGASTWMVATGELRPADLNGDVCADAIQFTNGHEPTLVLIPGTPSGLDRASGRELPIPQTPDLADDPDRGLLLDAIGLRHGGSSQVVLAGRHVWENDQYGPFIDTFTVGSDLGLVATHTIDLFGAIADATGFGVLAGSGHTVAVGAPADRVSGQDWAGAVYLYSPDDADPTKLVRRARITQNSPGVPGVAEPDDQFGASLAMRDGRLAIGAPWESDGRILHTGLVQPIRWYETTRTFDAYRAISQDTPGVPGSNEEGDRFGSRVAIARGLTASGSYDILIGADEDVARATDAGSVTVANVTRSLYRTYTQATTGVPGTVEAGDHFLSVGVLRTSAAVDTVLIGAFGEDSGGRDNGGYAIRSDGRPVSANTRWTSIAIPADAPGGLVGWGLDFAAG